MIAAWSKAAYEARATPAEMGEIFKRLAAACRGQPGETNDRKATMALFLRYLCDYSADVLARACDEWIKTKVFMPAISELRELCQAEATKLQRAWRRAQWLAGNSRAQYENAAREREEEARLAADRALRTPEWWAEQKAKRDALSSPQDGTDEIREKWKAHLAKRREEINARIPLPE